MSKFCKITDDVSINPDQIEYIERKPVQNMARCIVLHFVSGNTITINASDQFQNDANYQRALEILNGEGEAE